MAFKKKDGENTRHAILRSAIVLFLERGFSGATVHSISENAGMTTGAMFNFYRSKEELLCEIIGIMFNRQFEIIERNFSEIEPLLIYGLEASLQLHIAECSEALRDAYVSAYSLALTADLIHQKTTKKLSILFKDYLPDHTEKDFYELEIASAGVIRGYMARPCDMHFTMEQKVKRFLQATLRIYCVPESEIPKIIDKVLSVKLNDMAIEIVSTITECAENGKL